MKSDLVHIEFYFPNNKNNPKNKAKLVDLILDEMRESGSIDRAGFFDEKMLRRMVFIVCVLHEPATVRAGTVGHFLRKDDSCDRTLVIYIVLFIFGLLLHKSQRYM